MVKRVVTQRRKRKSKISNVIIHTVPIDDYSTIPGKIATLHASMIERRLRESGLAPAQKIAVIDMITEILKSQPIT